MKGNTQSEITRFVECVFGPDDLIEVRLLPSKRSTWHAAHELSAQSDTLTAKNETGENVYIGANPRIQHGGKSNTDVAIARCLFADLENVTSDEASARMAAANLPTPTLLLNSGHGVHVYFRLTEAMTDLEAWKAAQKRLIAALSAAGADADGCIHDAARIMRLPGFLNKKPGKEFIRCSIVHADAQRRFTLNSLLAALPVVQSTEPKPLPLITATSNLSKVSRAAAYIDKIPGTSESVAGGRNPIAFRVAAELLIDFDLSTTDAEPLMRKWNDRNMPPLDSNELAEVMQNAAKYGTGTPGNKVLVDWRTQPFVSSGEVGPVSISERLKSHGGLRKPIIHDLLREGETMNIIAPPKTGKSWLVYGLGLSIVTGKRWLDTFQTVPGKVLLVDNELHDETIQDRIPKVADALGLTLADYGEQFDVLTLRGRLKDINGLGELFATYKPGTYRCIIIDALYRAMPHDSEENSNSDFTAVYNLIDAHAMRMRSAVVLIHHASKGSQSDKSVTDVGAGAGAISRAADCHLVLRNHKEPDAVVLDSVVRSWPPIKPVCLRWHFPIWKPELALDPADLKPSRSRQRKPKEPKAKEEPWTAARFTSTFCGIQPKEKGRIEDDAIAGGLSERQVQTLMKRAESMGCIHPSQLNGKRAFSTHPPAENGSVAVNSNSTATGGNSIANSSNCMGLKRDIVLAALAADPAASDRIIAEKTGAARQYVNKLRKEPALATAV